MLDRYHEFTGDLLAAVNSTDPAALLRVQEFLGRTLTADQLRTRLAAPTADAARIFVARLYGFDGWSGFEAAVTNRYPVVHGLSGSPPFYRIRRGTLELLPALSASEWDEIFDVLRSAKITALHAGGQMTDAVLERLAKLDLLTGLNLEGSEHVTDAGLRHLARAAQLESLNLSNCDITDQGLRVLTQLPALREFQLFHHDGVSDAGLAHLAACQRLERVELSGTTSGDGTLRALAGKPSLRHFQSGTQVTDAGLAYLHDFPVFKKWDGRAPELSLMTFTVEPSHLLLRGPLTDHGIAKLAGLEGVISLNLLDSRLSLTNAAIESLSELPHLAYLGFDAKDENMSAIAALPHLRMLMCQDTVAGDEGFVALSGSRTLEYIWGRRCYNLGGRGFRALSRMNLRGLSVSCKNVDDGALSTLPEFPALTEFMPMDVREEGFRHIARCPRIEALWCMYCRDTGDAATQHVAAMPNLKTYYAGQTRITDRSLEILSGMGSVERVTLSACAGVTNAGVAGLAAIAGLRELNLTSMPSLTRDVLHAIPERVQVNYEI